MDEATVDDVFGPDDGTPPPTTGRIHTRLASTFQALRDTAKSTADTLTALSELLAEREVER